MGLQKQGFGTWVGRYIFNRHQNRIEAKEYLWPCLRKAFSVGRNFKHKPAVMKKHSIIILILLLSVHSKLTGQVPKDSELFLSLKFQDSIFFDRSFNRCEINYLENAIDKDLTFYHDKSGIQNRDKFIENTKKYICGDTVKKPIRKVEEQSLEVFPMYNNNVLYGAVQTGIHNFYIREKNKEDVLTSRAKFIHLYLLVNGKWILKEVISFDHQSPN
jgi:hypothetical protein